MDKKEESNNIKEEKPNSEIIPSYMTVIEEQNFNSFTSFFQPLIRNPWYTMIKSEDGKTWQYFDYISHRIDRRYNTWRNSEKKVAEENIKNRVKHKEINQNGIPTFMKIYDEKDFGIFRAFFLPIVSNPWNTMIKTTDGYTMEYFDYIGYKFAKNKNNAIQDYSLQNRFLGVNLTTIVVLKFFMRSWFTRIVAGPLFYAGMNFLTCPEVVDSVLLSPKSIWIQEYGMFIQKSWIRQKKAAFACKNNRNERF